MARCECSWGDGTLLPSSYGILRFLKPSLSPSETDLEHMGISCGLENAEAAGGSSSIWVSVSKPHNQHKGPALPEHEAHPHALPRPPQWTQQWVSELLSGTKHRLRAQSEAWLSGEVTDSPHLLVHTFPVHLFPRPHHRAQLYCWHKVVSSGQAPSCFSLPWTGG